MTDTNFFSFTGKQIVFCLPLSFGHGPWGGGGGESMDRWGCAILALEVVPKNLIFP